MSFILVISRDFYFGAEAKPPLSRGRRLKRSATKCVDIPSAHS
jgi:hypothetical protein